MNFKKIYTYLILFLFPFYLLNAQGTTTMALRKAYVEKYKDIAIKEMLRSGIPASITLAQGMLESDYGNSSLAKNANNHFGIKCHKNWTGATVYHDDDSKGECFRKYNSVYESFQDHSDFLMSGSRYSTLFELERTDYKGWARGLQKTGYATSQTYAEKLIRIIEETELHQYDLQSLTISAKQKSNSSPAGITTSGREVLVRNRVKYIITKPEDNFRLLQDELHLLPYAIYKYNDLARDQELKPGQTIYIQPKRNRAEVGNSWHVVKEGETMAQISQMYAVKLDKLYKKNLMVAGTEPEVGKRLSLRSQLSGKKPESKKKKESLFKEEEDQGELKFEFDQ